ncbi:hypothetical protein PoB_006446100 [Plakobranchus ocellatus]|uniref:Uncharacterized protein n=1 Tax=Plakobranchus ocellatus TaxID=259542 RepID=A0AAV4D1J1_9GAST|nr:hypothetical protein PoB_006446100 [Plakobranchus ocellatus]
MGGAGCHCLSLAEKGRKFTPLMATCLVIGSSLRITNEPTLEKSCVGSSSSNQWKSEMVWPFGFGLPLFRRDCAVCGV